MRFTCKKCGYYEIGSSNIPTASWKCPNCPTEKIQKIFLKYDHIECLGCRYSYKIRFPCPTTILRSIIKQFEEDHSEC